LLDAVNEFTEVEIDRFQGDLSGFDLADVEYIIDQYQEIIS